MLILNGKEVFKGIPRDKISANNRDFIAAREVLVPTGPKIGFSVEARARFKR